MSEELAEIEIHGLAAGGDGVGHLADGRAVFVALSAVGDRVRVRIIESKQSFARAEVVEVLDASDLRCEPRCDYFGSCGGCCWQHIAYPAQLDAKREILVEALRRIGRLELPSDIRVHPSPGSYAYRGRARLLLQAGGSGYRKRSSRELCAVEHCPILVPELEALLPGLSSRGDEAREVELTSGVDGATRAVRIAPRSKGRRRRGGDPICLEVVGERVNVSPGVFVQANVGLRDGLAQAVTEAATVGLEPNAALVELYAGAGFFTLPLARHFPELMAVESQRDACRDLRANLRAAALDRVSVVALPVEQALDRVAASSPEVIVLDPPRTGLGRTVASALAALGARRVVYLSCDPATLARDLAVMRSIDGAYHVTRVEGFDMFPQTAHVEALVVMERPDGQAGSEL